MKKSIIIDTVIFLNIMLFLYTGISKIQDYAVFKNQLTESPVLGPAANTIAILLPVVEFLVVLMLVVPRWRIKGLYTTLALMILFTGYITILIATSDNLPCSCGGIIEQLSWQQHIVFNAIFIVLDVLAIRLSLQRRKEVYKERNEIIDYKVSHS